jgi:WD40 repeat protein
VAFSADGQTLAFVQNGIWLWNTKTGQQRASLLTRQGVAVSVAFSGNGQTLASAGGLGIVRLWDVGTGQQRANLQGHERWSSVVSVAFSGDGQTLASAGQDGVRLWNTKTGQQRAFFQGHTGVRSVAFSGDGQLLASANSTTIVILWNVKAILDASSRK